MNWETIIGLEVHVQLNTKTKLFSTAPNRFGDEPNTNITEVCTGQPGALPVLNKEAVKKAIQFGLAIQADVQRVSTFDRKSYFYPDSPRNFQITQFYRPIIKGGFIIADIEGETKEFAVDRAHLEDDAGMLKHFTAFAAVDYNRAGVPLLEVVSKPVLKSAKEAVAYVMALKAIMQYIGASECNMEMGHLRVDANVSVRMQGEKELRPKTEIKNMNSFSIMEAAIETEVRRQIHLYTEHPHEPFERVINAGTYRYDPQKKEMLLMRKKESAEDYRYFPEPDLLPLFLHQSEIDFIKKTLPELPHERYKRYCNTLGLTPYNASILINEKSLADFFEEALLTCKNAKGLCNWITVEFAGRLKTKGLSVQATISPLYIGKLINMIDKEVITGKIAKMVADEMVAPPFKDPEKIVEANPDYKPLSDEATISAIVDEVLRENETAIHDYLNGKEKALAALVGQVMKRTKGKASPNLVNELILKKIRK